MQTVLEGALHATSLEVAGIVLDPLGEPLVLPAPGNNLAPEGSFPEEILYGVPGNAAPASFLNPPHEELQTTDENLAKLAGVHADTLPFFW
jgi:hypothetical protein